MVVPRAARAQRRKLVAVCGDHDIALPIAALSRLNRGLVESFWFRIDLAPQFAAPPRAEHSSAALGFCACIRAARGQIF